MTPILGIMASAAMGSKQSSFESIATVTLSSGSTTIDITSIPSTYKHLQLRILAKTASTYFDYMYARFNSDAGSNYYAQYVQVAHNQEET